MNRRVLAIWVCAALLSCVPAARLDSADSGLTEDRIRVAQIDSPSETGSPDQAQSDVGEQVAELSQRIDNLIKLSQQQQKIAQYQLVALAAICVLLVVLLASGLMRRRGI